MLSDFVNAVQSFNNTISEIKNKTRLACEILPPVSSVPSLFANLPVLILYIITLPLRFLLCPLLNVVGNPLCLIYNLFPPLGVLNALGSTNCKSFNCNNCSTSIPNPFAGCQGNVFNYLFCVLGGSLLSFVNPLIVLLNGVFSFLGLDYCLPYFSAGGCSL
ncbi:MAG: hypothetical protein QXD27_09290 [Metallosphaera sp.]